MPRVSSRSPALLLAGLVLLLAVLLRVQGFAVADRSPDELLWTKFGAAIAHEGPGWIPATVRAFDRGEDVEFPWPHRAGWSCLVGLVMRIAGRYDANVTEGIAAVSSVLLVALTGVLAFRALDPWTGVLAMLFLAVSPLDRALARRAWQDDPAALLTLLLAFAWLAAARARRPRAGLAAFVLLAVWALLFKESLAIPVGLGFAGLATVAWRRERRVRAAVPALLAGALTGAAAFALLLALSGGWEPWRQLQGLAKEANAPDDYMRHYQSGGPEYYLVGLGLLQPVPWLLGAIGALVALVRPRALAGAEEPAGASRVRRALAALVAVFLAVSFAYFSKNMRFLSPLYAPVALLAGALVTAAIRTAFARLPRRAALALAGLAVVALAASAAIDVAKFQHYFVEDEIQDLATPWFTQADADTSGN